MFPFLFFFFSLKDSNSIDIPLVIWRVEAFTFAFLTYEICYSIFWLGEKKSLKWDSRKEMFMRKTSVWEEVAGK